MILPRSSYEYDIAEIACAKLGRLDLIDKIKIAISKSYHLANHYGHLSLGFVCWTGGMKKSYPKIILYPHFRELPETGRKKILEHELCHVVDGTQKHDATPQNGGHGESFKYLMSKLGYSEIGIENELIGNLPGTLSNLADKFPNSQFKKIQTYKNKDIYYRRVS